MNRQVQSQTDREKAIKIVGNHKDGQYCGKYKNQCSICCNIRFIVRVLRHFGNACNKTTKCPVCYWKVQKNDFSINCYETQMSKLVCWLYESMLGIKFSYIKNNIFMI